jgi:hypothetical protein
MGGVVALKWDLEKLQSQTGPSRCTFSNSRLRATTPQNQFILLIIGLLDLLPSSRDRFLSNRCLAVETESPSPSVPRAAESS